MENDGIHVVLGAGGGTGAAVTAALAQAGRRVRAVGRRPAPPITGVEQQVGDVTKAEDLRRVLHDAAVVYHCAQPAYTRWSREFPDMNRAILAACEEVGAVLVFADNLYMYDATGPISEGSAQVPPTGRGALRKQMADELLDAHRAGRVRVRIGRSSDYFGPGGTGTSLGDRLFDGVLDGTKAQWMGSLDMPHAASYLPDMARALVTLGERNEADGRAWVLPADEALTGRAFIALAANAAGTTPKATAISPAMMRIAGLFSPMIRAYAEMLPEWTAPFTIDASAFQEAFGPFQVTPNRDAIATTVAWFQEQRREAAVSA
jgi:nucleoside-diphosphate-sugar epimerase